VEIAKSEQDSSNLLFLLIEFFLVEGRHGSLHVGLESRWRLVGQLNGSLKKTNGDGLDGIRRKEESELLVRTLHGVAVKDLFKSLQEVRHELNVLQEDPVTFFVSQLKLVEGNNILTITKGHRVEVLDGINVVLAAKVLHINDWVSTRREDEVNRSSWGGISVRVLEDLERRGSGIALGIVNTIR
jgi:hypothetical protein